MGRVSGRVALVTGGAMGLGRGIAGRLVEEGATVLVTDLNEELGAAAATELGCTFLPQDVSLEADWERVISDVETRHGALHILVNNAGIEGSPDAPKDPENAPVADWDRILAVNTIGVFLGCRRSIPLMARSGGGSIVNLSSVASLVPTPFITAYGASKAAVDHLSRSVALHCAQAGHRIRCNTVHPGQVRTPMLEVLFERMAAQQGVSPGAFAEGFRKGIPLGHFQEPRDIADAVLFLASDESRYITGESIAVDGGFTLAH